MATKKGKELVYESFEDRKLAVLVGALCLIYFVICYLPIEGTGWVAKILPLWPLKMFGCLALATVILQIVVWKLFHHFYPKWFLNPATLVLFICEYGLILFTIVFFSWPFFGVWQYIVSKKTGF